MLSFRSGELQSNFDIRYGCKKLLSQFTVNVERQQQSIANNIIINSLLFRKVNYTYL